MIGLKFDKNIVLICFSDFVLYFTQAEQLCRSKSVCTPSTCHSHFSIKMSWVDMCSTFQKNSFGNWQKQRQENVQHARITWRSVKRRMEVFLGARQSLYHVGATSVRSLKDGAPPLSICPLWTCCQCGQCWQYWQRIRKMQWNNYTGKDFATGGSSRIGRSPPQSFVVGRSVSGLQDVLNFEKILLS